MINLLSERLFCFQSLQVSSDLEREELKNALVATQESAAIQILLEAVLGNTDPAQASSSSEQVTYFVVCLKQLKGLLKVDPSKIGGWFFNLFFQSWRVIPSGKTLNQT